VDLKRHLFLIAAVDGGYVSVRFILVPLEWSWTLWKRQKSVYFAGNGTQQRPACRLVSTPTELSPFPPVKFMSGITPGGLARQEHKRV